MTALLAPPVKPDEAGARGDNAQTGRRPPDATVLPAFRNDLIISRQIYEGNTFYVVKDPVSLQYYRLSAEDYALATLFDGRRTFGEVREAFQRAFPHVRLEYTAEQLDERLLRFANDLALMQFLKVQGARLNARKKAAESRKLPLTQRIAKMVGSIFFMRFSLFDPDELFARMEPGLRWIWTRGALVVSSLIVAAALVVFIFNLDKVNTPTADFFSFQNVVLMGAAFFVIKSIHEFGHGLTCKHFGGEVHQIGLMFLVFTPCFFVNVTDSWMMPKRSHRVLISAAGIYVEVVLAAFATFLWALAQPGPLQQFLFNMMFLASISTILFNANPLMRFDGYYMMVDLIETPNLQAKSRAVVGHRIKKLLVGPNVDDGILSRMPLPKKRPILFNSYAILSYIYGYYLTYSICMFMAPRLEPYGMETFAYWLSGIALVAWVGVPILGFFGGLKMSLADMLPGKRGGRLGTILVSVILGFIVLCAIPVDLVIQRSVALQASDDSIVRTRVTGRLVEVHAPTGAPLQAGDPIATLENREVRLAFETAETKLRIAQAMMSRAIGLGKPAEVNAAEVEIGQSEIALAEAKAQADELTLRAPVAGLLATPDLEKNIGQYVQAGTPFCEVLPLETIHVLVPLTQHQVRWVKAGHKVQFRATAFPDKNFEGQIEADPMLALDNDLPPGLSKTRAGDVEIGVDREGREIPLEKTFVARISIANPGGILRHGMTGHAKIQAGRHLWGRLALQSILDFISLDLRV